MEDALDNSMHNTSGTPWSISQGYNKTRWNQ